VRIPHVPTIIVDRNSMFRSGLAHALAHTRFTVIGEYSSIGDVTAGTIPSTDCILLIGLDDEIRQSTIDFREFRTSDESLHVIILGEQTDEQELQAVINFWGKCYILKDDINSDNLLQYLELVMAGQIIFTHDLMRILWRGWASRSAIAAPPQACPPDTDWEVQRLISLMGDGQSACRLSERETAILMRLMHGASNKSIARELDIAEATVKVHVKSVLRKIRVKNRTQAATWAWARCSQQANSPEPDGGISAGFGPQMGRVANGVSHDDPVQPPVASAVPVRPATNIPVPKNEQAVPVSLPVSAARRLPAGLPVWRSASMPASALRSDSRSDK